jgi:DNA repair exonuclease SbcCD nuclease subunit
MNSLRFFHAADLHLDTPFKGLSGTPHMATTLHAATFTALERLTSLCIARRADFLLVAGDIYNHEEGSLKAQFALRDACEKLHAAGIGVFIVHGNHDFAGSRITRMQWPPNVVIFGTDNVETVPVVRSGKEVALIHGISHAARNERSNMARRFTRDTSRADLPQIGLLHCTVASVAAADRYAPCTAEDLKAAGMDYWALGHVHERQTVLQTPLSVYPGNIQGLHINETGPRGCYEVTYAPEDGFSLRFHRLGPVVWERLSVSIDTPATLDALEEEIHRRIAACCTAVQKAPQNEESGSTEPPVEAWMLRLTLEGRGPLNQPLRAAGGHEELTERLRTAWADASPTVWIKDIDLRCRPEADMEALRSGDNLLGETLRLVQQARDALEHCSAENGSTATVAQELLSGPLAPLFAAPQAKRLLDEPDTAALHDLLDSVEMTCLDLLEAR